jgi:hypothetical protein
MKNILFYGVPHWPRMAEHVSLPHNLGISWRISSTIIGDFQRIIVHCNYTILGAQRMSEMNTN